MTRNYKVTWENDSKLLELKNRYDLNIKKAKEIKNMLNKNEISFIYNSLNQKLNEEIKKAISSTQEFEYKFINSYHAPKQLQLKYKISANDEKKIIQIYQKVKSENSKFKVLYSKHPDVIASGKELVRIDKENFEFESKLLDFQMQNIDKLAEAFPEIIVSRAQINYIDQQPFNTKKFTTVEKQVVNQALYLNYKVGIEKYHFGIKVNTPENKHNYIQPFDIKNYFTSDFIQFWTKINTECKNQLKFNLPTDSDQVCKKVVLIPQDEETQTRFEAFQKEILVYDKIQRHTKKASGSCFGGGYNPGYDHICFGECNVEKTISYNVAITKMGFYNIDKFVKDELFTFKGNVKIKSQQADSLKDKIVVYLVAQDDKIVLTELLNSRNEFTFRFPKDKKFHLIALVNNEAIGFCKVKSSTDEIPELVVNQTSKEDFGKHLSMIFGEK